MTTLSSENTKFRENGNWWVGQDTYPNTKEISVEFDWGYEKLPRRALVNIGTEPILLKNGYTTQRLGGCDDLIIAPGEGIICTGNGDAHSFSEYRIFLYDAILNVASAAWNASK